MIFVLAAVIAIWLTATAVTIYDRYGSHDPNMVDKLGM